MKTLNLPPFWLIAFIAVAWAMAQVWAPWGSALVWPGWTLVAAGLALAIWCAVVFRRSRTTIVPRELPSALVESGPYRYSRNPIYLADLVILAGVALILGAPLALGLLVPFYLVLQHQFILPEEAVLERELGQPYLDFKARVRRWI
jgi:protein-S-isoprenylcysteine O-methyltransferase Ste14